ncbi:MAG: hypothetical protein KAJ19_30290 [Gammaproteobacteria bacterium]|nr:hypothetical protein [Gammaproteobacteria bacterium]
MKNTKRTIDKKVNHIVKLPKIKKGVQHSPRRFSRCPVHSGVNGTMTMWRPKEGLNPLMREYSCDSILGTHAFYVVHSTER